MDLWVILVGPFHLFGHGSYEGNSQEAVIVMAEIASFEPREYPHGSCRGVNEARSAVAIATSALPSFEPCPCSVKNPGKREMADVMKWISSLNLLVEKNDSSKWPGTLTIATPTIAKCVPWKRHKRN
jgi:hypothetical protein